MRAYLAALARYGRWRLTAAVVLTVLGGLTEGAAVVLLVPVLDVIGIDSGGGALGRAASAIRDLLDAIGLRTTIGPVLGLYVVVGCALALLHRISSVNTAELEHGFTAGLRRRLYDAIAASSWAFFSRQRSADLTHALTAEVDRVGVGTQQLVQLVALLAGTAVTVAIAIVVSPAATTAAVIGGGALVLLLRGRTRASTEAGRELGRATRLLYQTAIEHLAGMKTTKSHGTEAESAARFGEHAQAVGRSHLAAVRHVAGLRLWSDVGVVVVAAAVLAVAVQIAHLRPAETVLLLLVFLRLAPRLSTIQLTWSRLIATLPAFAAVQEVLAHCDAAREGAEWEGQAPELRDTIAVQGVSFSYAAANGRATLSNVSLTLPAGSTTALVGPSGGGKSTLVDLIVGLLRPDAGRVLIDGAPLDDGRARAWRQRVGYVGQDPFLLHDTVRANLLVAKPDATDDDLAEALHLAAADFVADLPLGLDTVVGDRGVLVSGGERQRLALARALLRRPALLVLDEATSNLDPGNEERILAALEGLHGQLTVLLVAHRPGTSTRADLVYRVDAGRLASPDAAVVPPIEDEG